MPTEKVTKKESTAPVEATPAVTDSEKSATVSAPRRRAKKKRQVTRAQAHILATYNNTIVTVTDQGGNTLVSCSTGKVGFKGPKKSTPYAAGVVVRTIAEKINDFGVKDVDIFVKGVGVGREAAIRALYANGFNVLSIKDITPIPHNGCRPRRPRRV
jgi:small subunit ribosomal protein S11